MMLVAALTIIVGIVSLDRIREKRDRVRSCSSPAASAQSALADPAPVTCTGKSNIQSYAPNPLTERELEDYIRYEGTFLSFFLLLSRLNETAKILEIGTGSGRALLEIKAMYPKMEVFGTNLKGYGFAQTNGSEQSFWAIGSHYQIPIYCDSNQVPLFPTVKETHPIQSPNYTADFENITFDFIFSRHALNQGKLAPHESHLIIPRILPLLKVDSLAMIHLLGGTFHPTSDNKYYPILKVYNVVLKSEKDQPRQRISFVIYQSLCFPDTFCINIAFKKCPPNFRLHWQYEDCIVPFTLFYVDPPKDWLLSELARISNVENVTRQKKIYKYAHDYMANLMHALKRWVKKGRVYELTESELLDAASRGVK